MEDLFKALTEPDPDVEVLKGQVEGLSHLVSMIMAGSLATVDDPRHRAVLRERAIYPFAPAKEQEVQPVNPARVRRRQAMLRQLEATWTQAERLADTARRSREEGDQG